MEIYEFTCSCHRHPFKISDEAPSRSLHFTLGVITLGVWLVFFALYRLGHVYWISKCPNCGKRSRSLLWIILLLAFFTIEVGRTLHFFLVSAPQKIVAGFKPSDIRCVTRCGGVIKHYYRVAA